MGADDAGGRAMLHFVGRGAFGTLLFCDWLEGYELWRRLVRAVPGLRSLVLMPDHFHAMHPLDVRRQLAHALSGYIRWRNHRRGRKAPGIEPLPAGEALVDRQKRQRSERYIHLNPCRARLCTDPLAWPFSTHRDACGLVVEPVVRPRSDVVGFHRYVSSDPMVHVSGTALPGDQLEVPTPEAVLDAVGAVTRTPVRRLLQRGRARTLYLAAACALQSATHTRIAALVGVDPTRVPRAVAPPRHIRLVRRVLGDPRFVGLDETFLPRLQPWREYIARKGLHVPTSAGLAESSALGRSFRGPGSP